ncbi:histidine phosphatase family protein [Hyphomonas sp.]|uniref:histidine phosphatase family protein n=1 Tax=Hyphomonas sp. TaxID=87 RepID=UPI0039188D5F
MAAHLNRRGLLAALCAAVLAACAAGPAREAEQQPVAEPPARFFLVRHAEKDTGNDPGLTAAGAARAAALAERLEGEGVTHIWSTATRRTQETARPLAGALGLGMQTYDASDLGAFARQLEGIAGVHLVIGHSNTTGQLAGQLGADPGAPIEDGWEFDRLYVISLDQAGAIGSRIERYGAPSLASAGAAP